MNFTELISAIEKFLNDLLGRVIPGGVLLLGLDFLKAPELVEFTRLKMSNTGTVFVIIVIAYMLGHLLSEIYNFCRKKWNAIGISKTKKIKEWQTAEGKTDDPADGEIEKWEYRKLLEDNHSFLIFNGWVAKRISALGLSESVEDIDLKDGLKYIEIDNLRSIAMTLNKEGEFLSRKFTFIELFCRSTATALIVLILTSILLSIFVTDKAYDFSISKLIAIILMFIVACLFYDRSARYYDIADTVCYDCAVADILKEQKPPEQSGDKEDGVKDPMLVIKLLKGSESV